MTKYINITIPPHPHFHDANSPIFAHNILNQQSTYAAEIVLIRGIRW